MYCFAIRMHNCNLKKIVSAEIGNNTKLSFHRKLKTI